MNRIRQITQQPIFLILFVFFCFSVLPAFSSTGTPSAQPVSIRRPFDTAFDGSASTVKQKSKECPPMRKYLRR